MKSIIIIFSKGNSQQLRSKEILISIYHFLATNWNECQNNILTKNRITKCTLCNFAQLRNFWRRCDMMWGYQIFFKIIQISKSSHCALQIFRARNFKASKKFIILRKVWSTTVDPHLRNPKKRNIVDTYTATSFCECFASS